jgi:glutathione S-transferase
METKPIELHYWSLRGRGTLVSHFLSYLKIPFNYNRITNHEEWKKEKSEIIKTFPLVNLPYIKDPNNNDKLISETQAILYYLAHNFKPETGPSHEELADFMMINGMVHDMTMGVGMSISKATTKEEIPEKVSENKDRFKSKLMMLENVFESGEWLFKNRFTFLDINFALFTELMVAMESELEFEFFTENQRKLLSSHMERVYSQEGIQKWRNSSEFSARPFFAGFAIWR